MSRGNDLTGNVETWLNNQGYPLEFRAASSMRRAGFKKIIQSLHLGRAQDSEQEREVGVVSFFDHKVARPRFSIRLINILECHPGSEREPWVVFCGQKSGTTPERVAATTLRNTLGSSIMSRAVASYQTELSGIGAFKSAPGFGLTTCGTERGAAGSFRQTARKVMAAAQAVASTHALTSERIALVFPVLVTGGRLFEARYEDSGERLAVQEVGSSRLHWCESEDWFMTIDVVTVGQLDQFASERFADFLVLSQLLAKSAAHPA